MKFKFIITAGGTSEKIDNVRKITNSGSGKLGCTIANELIKNKNDYIDKIYYICSKESFKPKNKKIEIIEIFDTSDLEETVKKLLKTEKIDYFIHSMAVSDYTVDYVTTIEKLSLQIDSQKTNTFDTISNFSDGFNDKKISSNEDNLIIKLKKTPKVISIIKDISPSTFLVGFKLLDSVSENKLLSVAQKLKDKNNCNLVVANDLNSIRLGNHKAFIIKDNNTYIEASRKR